MKKLILTLLIISVVLALFLLGDFLNIPLWPADFLSKRCPVDIRLILENIQPEETFQMIKSIGGIPIEIFSSSNDLVYSAKSDLLGRIHLVLPMGQFKLYSKFTTVADNKCFQFSTTSSSSEDKTITFEVTKNKCNYSFTLKPDYTITQLSLFRTLELFLQNADIKSALIIARQLDNNTYSKISDLDNKLKQLETLPVFAYNPKIALLIKIRSILKEFCGDDTRLYVLVSGRKLELGSHLKAIVKARNIVLKWFANRLKESYKAGRLEQVLGIWNRLSTDTNVFPPELDGSEESLVIKSQLKFFDDRIEEISSQVQADVQYTFRKTEQIYEKGKLDLAKQNFSRLLSDIRKLEMQNEFIHLKLEIQSYLDDIALIAAADQAIRDDQLEKALSIFDVVLHPNQLVIRKIEESQRFLALKSY